MKTTLKKDLPIIAVVLFPFIYLAYIWTELPEVVPIHWNIEGNIDGYGNKSMLILIPILLPLLVYLIFLIVPMIDPKNKLHQMGNKLQTIKGLLTIFMSLLAVFILYTSKNQTFNNPNYILLSLGVLFLILGNYFKTIKPNYFIGIKTPWALESESNWKSTHKLAGKIWFVGGFLIILSSLILTKENNSFVFIAITSTIVIVPIIYSYSLYKRDKNNLS